MSFPIIRVETDKDPELMAYNMATKAGFTKHLGSGLFSAVFSTMNPCGRVYKIGYDSKFENGFQSYVKVLYKQKTHNPFTPKIFAYIEIFNKAMNKGYFVCSMEHLKEIDYYLDSGKGKVIEEAAFLSDAELPKNPDSFEQMIAILREAIDNSYRAIPDMHDGNVMFRGDQLVVTDPLI